ncbi:UNVERIFIED_CONTAM: hypothetical protein FKN15_032113 [Acipenser sinensis]
MANWHPRAMANWHPRAMHDRAAAVPQEAMAAADPWEVIAGGEPGPAVMLGLALFSVVATRQFSPLLGSATYARAAADRQPPVPVRPVLKGEAAPAPLPQVVVVEVETAPAALLLAKAAGAPPLLAVKAAGAPPLLAAKAAEAPPLLAAKSAGAPPLLAAAGKPSLFLCLFSFAFTLAAHSLRSSRTPPECRELQVYISWSRGLTSWQLFYYPSATICTSFLNYCGWGYYPRY